VELEDRRISVFKKAAYALDSLAISATGNWIVASDINGWIFIWNTAGEELRRLERPFRSFSLGFTRDDRYLLAGLSNGRVEAWPVPVPLEEFLATGLVEPLSEEQMKQYDVRKRTP